MVGIWLMNKTKGEVLVVHCIDTEGPIGGDVRRRPDGSKEFLDNWRDIQTSIKRLTNPSFRKEHADSFGNPYLYNWFIMDFMGFKTNPKNRIQKYNDTYDHFKKLPTQPDGFYWHYHHPPKNGIGDQWSWDWDSSQEYLNILLHRLVERKDFPESYRAGGTIEDEKASAWLENNILVDYSNRVSGQATKTEDIFDFNWYGAPDHWGYYHPAKGNLLKKGSMKRFIVRSVDLWSRLHVLTIEEVRQAFEAAKKTNGPVILSYFSHDHRDMYDETEYGIAIINQVAKESGIAWRTATALEAVQKAAKIKPEHISVRVKKSVTSLTLTFSKPIYQQVPWVGAKVQGRGLLWLPVVKKNRVTYEVALTGKEKEIVIGGTSQSGNKFVKIVQ